MRGESTLDTHLRLCLRFGRFSGFSVQAAWSFRQVNTGRVSSGRFGSHKQRLADGLDWTLVEEEEDRK